MDSSRTIDDQLREFEQNDSVNWQALIFNLRKHFDSWSHIYIGALWKDIKLSHLPVIFNVSVDGSSVSEIAKKLNHPKQSVSRSIKELEVLGFVSSATCTQDKRVEVLTLTDLGKSFILDAKGVTARTNDIYKKLVGENELKIATEVIMKIIAFYESNNDRILEVPSEIV
ncbi:MarR family winged helix-turn-helix transcriptional regulator [Pedobacter sp. BMA]|uniref:MarR family winged helix-turn-helix transcriptional regulator n=1 Tax=Pedobacter sp. BMA TaxID=1663685 RepID=UPI000649B434|nr:helix-turn-helix domain-containing protein [Pedobacter sp. BMA]KLT67080.1 hypothetical protein AB669_04070 [Pedobacter sp. BMA]